MRLSSRENTSGSMW